MSELELNSVNDTTLLISWGEPVSPNGNILSYSITITDLRDDSTVRRVTEESTSFMETNLGKLFITSIYSLRIHQYMSLLGFLYINCHLHSVVYTAEPGVPYNVSIAAVNRAGMGEVSAMILFTRELG